MYCKREHGAILGQVKVLRLNEIDNILVEWYVLYKDCALNFRSSLFLFNKVRLRS